MMRIILFALNLLLFSFPLNAQETPSAIQFERPSKQRLEQEIASYRKKRQQKRVNEFLGSCAVGAGLVGTGVAGYKLWNKMDGGERGEIAENNTNKDSFLTSFKNAIVFTFAIGVSGVLLKTLWSSVSYVSTGVCGRGVSAIKAVTPLIKRLSNTLTRIDFAVHALKKQQEDDVAFQFQSAELASAFSLFIRSLEKCCAIITVELQTKYQSEDPVLQNWADTADRLLVYCNSLAECLQDDFTSEPWDQFDPQTLLLLGGLEHMMAGAFSEITGGSRSGRLR